MSTAVVFINYLGDKVSEESVTVSSVEVLLETVSSRKVSLNIASSAMQLRGCWAMVA
jgi:hypothetical protein